MSPTTELLASSILKFLVVLLLIFWLKQPISNVICNSTQKVMLSNEKLLFVFVKHYFFNATCPTMAKIYFTVFLPDSQNNI